MNRTILLLNIIVVALMATATYQSEHPYLCSVIVLTGVYITLNRK
jgi:hypothetical protein